jgi:basic membrane protein A
LLLAGCGGTDPSATSSDSAEALTVGIFVDNAFGDGDFLDQGALATEPLESELGAKVTTYEGQLQAQNFGPLLQDAADANEIVFVLGFEAIDAMNAAAADNPDTTFVFIDGDAGSEDVVSAVFRTQEGCFMAGALAATVDQTAGATTAGFIGGVNAPVIENCESGYTQGVAQVDPAQTVASQYVGSFTDPAKGSEIASSLASTRGAYAMFAYAGLSGSGAFDAAKSGLDIAPIGVVADKSALAPGLVPGSLIMGVDTVIVDIANQYADGSLERGSVHEYGFDEGGWDMLYDTKLLTADQIAALDDIEAGIVSGEISVSE